MKYSGLWKSIVLFSLFLIIGLVPARAAQPVKTLFVPPITNDHHRYCLGLLKLALSYSDTTYTFDFIDDSKSQTREIQRIRDGKADVIWLATSNLFESQARPIRIPLYRGLLGHRILIIRQAEQYRFNDVNTFEDLKAIRFGQGADWTDTTILKASGLQVVTSRVYENLFYMLDGGRFDAFPRGVHEAWEEVENWSRFNFEVEKRLAFVYRMPLYFFVNKDNLVLASDIEKGLLKAIHDGSFDRYFFANRIISDALGKADLEHRRIFYLSNPDLPPQTPINDKRFWWSPQVPSNLEAN